MNRKPVNHFARKVRKLAWPATKITDIRHELSAMAELSGMTITKFVRDAVMEKIASEHDRLFPGVEMPWRHDTVMRVAESDTTLSNVAQQKGSYVYH